MNKLYIFNEHHHSLIAQWSSASIKFNSITNSVINLAPYK